MSFSTASLQPVQQQKHMSYGGHVQTQSLAMGFQSTTYDSKPSSYCADPSPNALSVHSKTKKEINIQLINQILNDPTRDIDIPPDWLPKAMNVNEPTDEDCLGADEIFYL